MEFSEKRRGHSGRESQPSTSSGKRQHEQEDKSASKRHDSGKQGSTRRNQLLEIAKTRPHNEPTSFTQGNRVVLETNYFAVGSQITRNFDVYKYHVTIEPDCELKRLRAYLLAQHKPIIGGFLFDGTQLYTTRKLHTNTNPVAIELTSSTREEREYKLRVVFTRHVVINSIEYFQVLNLIVRQFMKGLKLEQVGRNHYDPRAMIDLSRQFRIQMWPGYNTSIRSHECGILLNCDVAHKVMRTDTVYDLMKDIHRSNQNNQANFQREFKQRVLGMTVLTEYNNKTYRIDDVNFELTPQSIFTKGDREISLRQYYREYHNREISDLNQPILIILPRAREMRGGQVKEAWLVPELCRITGLSERQRNDPALKRALRPYTQSTPRDRRLNLLDFNARIQNSVEAEKTREEWQIQVATTLQTVNAHYFGAETLKFGNSQLKVRDVSWDRECGRNLHQMYVTAHLNRWAVVYPRSMDREMRQFVRRLRQLASAMNFQVEEPKWTCVDRDEQIVHKVDEYARVAAKLLLFGTTTNKMTNADWYSRIKKKCFGDYAIPCQVVTRSALTSTGARYDSVVTKLAVQLCTKLGGAPWIARNPLKESMTIGYDIAKDSCNRNISYGCLVATIAYKEGNVEFFSAVSRLDTQDSSSEFILNVFKAIKAFEDSHGNLPKHIFIYRGGIGEGDLMVTREIEVNNLITKLRQRYKGVEPNVAYIVVSKGINTRFFLRKSDGNVVNPEPGTVVDNTVTLRERYEFFLVSQKSNQGTVSPTNYNVIYDTTQLTPERMQTLTYIQTHMYYNWYGTTRIPAVLQYANKLGFLVSNYMHRVPNIDLCSKLFFL